jgi:hypothetical protein
MYLPSAEGFHARFPALTQQSEAVKSKKWKPATENLSRQLASTNKILHESPIFVNRNRGKLFIFPAFWEK